MPKNKKKKNKQTTNVENGVGETVTRDQDMVNRVKEEHVNLSEAAVNLNEGGETSSRDQNLVTNDKDGPAQLLEIADEQSVNVDSNGVVEVPNRDLNLLESGNDEHIQPPESTDGESSIMDSNGHLPNGKECVSFPSINIDFRRFFVLYAHDSWYTSNIVS